MRPYHRWQDFMVGGSRERHGRTSNFKIALVIGNRLADDDEDAGW